MRKTLKVLGTAVSLTSSVGVGAILGNAVKIVTPPNTGKLMRLAINVGTIGLGAVVGESFDNKINKFLGLDKEEKEEPELKE